MSWLRTSLKWLYPNMHVKRWVALGFIGFLAFMVGMGVIIQAHEGLDKPLAVRFANWLIKHVHIGLLRPGQLGVMLTVVGASLCLIALAKLIESLTSVLDPEMAPGGLVDIVYQRRRLTQGRRIVVIGGGTGLSTMLRGLKRYSANITAIVTVADDGGSSGKLQKQLHILPPGDIRNCLVALADAEPQMTELFQYRFRNSIKPEEGIRDKGKGKSQGTGNREQGTEGNAERGMMNDEYNAESNSSLITHHSSLPLPSPLNPQPSTMRDVLLPEQRMAVDDRRKAISENEAEREQTQLPIENRKSPIENPQSAIENRQSTMGEGLRDHAFGNLLIAAMCAINDGDFERGVRETSRVLNIRGQVLPTTVDEVKLRGEMEDGSFVDGETNIAHSPLKIKRVTLVPEDACPLQAVLDAIAKADVIVMGPGSVFTSVIPNLLVRGVPEAIRRSKAKKVYVCNVMTQPGETDGFSASDHVRAIERHAGTRIFNYVLVNTQQPDITLLEKYRKTGAVLVEADLDRLKSDGYRPLPGNYINETDVVRHDAGLLAKAIMGLMGN